MNRSDSASMTRRQMVGRTAAGAALLWAAPTVTTLGQTPAAAGSATGSCPVPSLVAFDGSLDFSYGGQLVSGADLTQNDASPFSSNTEGFVFNESGPIQIPAGGYASETAVIPAGTWVCSIYVHASSTSGSPRYRGTISVPGATILGYDGHTANLQNSDPLFAVPGVNYSGAARQHEWTSNANGNGDYYGQITSNASSFRMAVSDCCVDHGRLFVSCL